MGDQKGFSKMIVSVAIVTLLSFCSPASSFAFLPRVSRTNDAVIVDFDGMGYGPSYQGKTLYGQIVDPRFVPVPSLNPYPAVVYRQQEQEPSGWSYSYEYPNPITVGDLLSVKQTAATCGTGPIMPASRALTSERVAGGSSAKKGAWPFMVALKKAADGSLLCSGTLISDTRVLLAAQCLEKLSLAELNGVTVLVGMYLTDQSDVQMTRRISKMFLHSKYNAATFANDIAIIAMDAPVTLSKSVAPACLPAANTDPDQFVDQDAVILGWGGGTVAAGPPPVTTPFTNLQQAKVSIQANGDCKSDPTAGKYVSDTTICIYSANSNRFTCPPTDVGAPVVILPAANTWTVVGINSYTKDCATNGLKTRVSAFRAWIDQYMTA